MKSIEWVIAWRYIRAKRSESFIAVTTWFSLIGIALGVATLIIVMSVMNGFRKDIIERILGINGHIQVYVGISAPQEYATVTEALKKIQGVENAMEVLDESVMGASGGNGVALLMRGIAMADMKDQKLLMKNFSGDINAFKGNTIIIGYRLARQLNLKIGSELTIIAPKGFSTLLGTIPRIGRLTVAGIFNIGMSEFDSTYTFVPMDTMQDFFMTTHPSRIEVFIKDPQQAASIAPLLKKNVQGIRTVRPWQESHESFISALAVERNVMFLILTLIILVASFNIIAGMIMLVRTKTKDIAILRTMGATRGQLLRIFFIIGSSIGIAGTLLGSIVGILICINIEAIRRMLEKLLHISLFPAEVYYLTQLPVSIKFQEVLLVVLIALALSTLAALYPSWRASKVYPAESLRHD